jgi:hypothetical protein
VHHSGWRLGAEAGNAVGNFPYADKSYAKAAIKKFAESKGGEAIDDTDHSKHRKHGS